MLVRSVQSIKAYYSQDLILQLQIGCLQASFQAQEEEKSQKILRETKQKIDEGYKAKLLARAAEEGLESQVIYGGEIAPGEQLNRYYNVAEAMLFPATSEAFGLVIIEAMAAGVPAIVPSQLNVNLRGYVAYANEDEFRSLFTFRILDLVEHDHLAALARETAESTYSWDVVAQDYASAILSCMDDNLK